MRSRLIPTAVVVLAACIAAQGEPSLTIYNQDFAVVRESVPLDLKAGTNEVQVTNISAHLEPSSVILRDPTGRRDLQILEQNYRSDPISQGLLLSLYEGKEIGFLVTGRDGDTSTVRGRIIRSGYVPHQAGLARYGQQYSATQRAYTSSNSQPIIEVDGQLRFNLPGTPLFPALADDTILKPTLQWRLQSSRAGNLDAELSYVTGGMSWEADYNLISPTEGDMLDVIGWVTMDNQCGRNFENARIKLMAGDVSRIQQEQPYLRAAYVGDELGSIMQPAVTEQAFDEYHLYTLAHPTTLHDRETKQVEFLRAEDVQAQRLYIYDGVRIDSRYRGYSAANIRDNRDYGTQSNPKVWVMREFTNSEDNHLGIPLPRGRVRFYRQHEDGQLEFTGENVIDHTPRDETVRVYTGDAFDLVGERTRTDYQIDTRAHWLDESFEIKVRNRKEEGTAEIRVVEHLYRWTNWDITESSNTFLKTDSKTIEFRIQVPAGQEKTVTYTVHYTW